MCIMHEKGRIAAERIKRECGAGDGKFFAGCREFRLAVILFSYVPMQLHNLLDLSNQHQQSYSNLHLFSVCTHKPYQDSQSSFNR